MTRTAADTIVVTHLRASAGSGGGPEKTIFNTASRIDRSRFDYRVIYLCKHGHDLDGIRHLAAAHGADLRILSGRSVFDCKQYAAVLRELRRSGTHILHAHDPKSNCYARLCGLFIPRLLRVTTLHGYILKPNSRKSAVYAALDHRLLSSFHAVIAVSSPLQALAQRYGARRCVLLHNAVDTQVWNREQAEQRISPDPYFSEGFVVGFVGRLSLEKGVLDFLEIARRASALCPELRFVLAGEGPLEKTAQDQAAALGIAGRVRFLGQRTPEELFGLYARLGCLLSPSHTEGLPNTLLEAMAMETPVVATDVGGVGELLTNGQTGLLYTPQDLDGMARAVVRLAQDPELAGSLARRARQKVAAAFSFTERTARLTALYESLANRGLDQDNA